MPSIALPVEHGFTHGELRLTVRVADAAVGTPAPGCRWTAEAGLGEEALPKLVRKVAAAVAESIGGDPPMLQTDEE